MLLFIETQAVFQRVLLGAIFLYYNNHLKKMLQVLLERLLHFIMLIVIAKVSTGW